MSRKSLTKLSNCWRDLLTPDYYTPIHSNHPGSPCRFRIVSSTFTLVTDCHSKLTSPFEFLWEKLILTKPVLPSQIIGRQSATLTTFKGSLAPEGGVRGVAVTAATGAGTRGGAPRRSDPASATTLSTALIWSARPFQAALAALPPAFMHTFKVLQLGFSEAR